MKEMIIDMHAHLGDILYPQGGNLIHQKGVRKRFIFDPNAISEFFDHRFSDEVGPPDGWLYRQIKKAGIAANAIGTLENFKISMAQAGINFSVALPIPPNLTFQDLKPISDADEEVISFTGVDFTREYDVQAALDRDVRNGARGLKLHPILQRVKLTDNKIHNAIEAFAPHDLPVLLHTGVFYYYLLPGDKKHEKPEYGAIHYVRELVAAFPGVKFIMGHAGLTETQAVKETLAGFDNVWIETSSKGVAAIKDLINIFGSDKILFGSDWPWGNRKPALRIIRHACKGNKKNERKILFQNGADLLKLEFGEHGNIKEEI
jgi:uncharacterized protein